MNINEIKHQIGNHALGYQMAKIAGDTKQASDELAQSLTAIALMSEDNQWPEIHNDLKHMCEMRLLGGEEVCHNTKFWIELKEYLRGLEDGR